jgi:3-oxoacyl-[acyl-carrier-protein] synthase III
VGELSTAYGKDLKSLKILTVEDNGGMRLLLRTMLNNFGISTVRQARDGTDGLTELQLHDVDLVIPHQASPAALTHMIRQTGFARDRVVDIIADHGNQIAASIPFVLDTTLRAGRMPPGTRTLLLGTSAGVSFGGMAYVA